MFTGLKPFLIALCFCALTSPASAAGTTSAPDASGDYLFSYFGNKIEVKIVQDGPSIQAVATVLDWFGRLKTYHFTGAMNNGRIKASNPTGHLFTGRCPTTGRLIGVIKTRSGLTVPFDVARR